MSPATVDKNTIENAIEGDQSAFREIYEQYKAPLFNFIVRMTGNRADAEDILQNVFVKIFRKITTLRASGAFTTWLFTTARNETINHIRKRDRRKFDSIENDDNHQLDEQILSSNHRHVTPETNATDSDLQKKVEAALMEVPEVNRAAFVLGVLEGYSYKEVGEMLDCSVSNVKLRVFRTRAILTKKLRPYFN